MLNVSAPASVSTFTASPTASRRRDLHLCDEAGHDHAARRRGDGDAVRARRAPGDDRVGLDIAAAAEQVEVDLDSSRIGAGEVVDDDCVGTAEGVVADALHVVEVRHDGG